MKRNPWLVVFSMFGVFAFLVLVAMGAALYTAFGPHHHKVSRNSVMVMDVKGIIVDSRGFNKTLEKYQDNDDVKAIVVRLDSPGGVVGPSQEIYEALKKVRAETKKPVVASMGSLAASGAYYVAVGCDKIFTNPGTITGSIGVIMEFANISDLYKWAKIDRYVIKTGPYKDIGSETRAMTPEEKQLLQNMINNVYDQFKGAVAQGRKLKPEEVARYADGRIFSGEQAVKYGFADQLGGLQDAITEAAKMAGIDGKPEVFYPSREKRRFMDLLLGNEDEDEVSLDDIPRKLLGLELVGKPLFLMPGAR